jgi:hypothetical protein
MKINFKFCFFIFLWSYFAVFETSIASDNTKPNQELLAKSLVPLKPFVVPVIQKRQIQAFFAFDLVLDCQKDEYGLKVVPWIPRLQDWIFRYLYGILSTIWEPGYSPDTLALRKRILYGIHQYMGEKWIKDILFRSMNIQESVDGKNRGP